MRWLTCSETQKAQVTPLDGLYDFAVADRAGEGVNLQEHCHETPFLIR